MIKSGGRSKKGTKVFDEIEAFKKIFLWHFLLTYLVVFSLYIVITKKFFLNVQ